MSYRVTTEEFEAIAVEALDTIPAALRARMDADNLMITIDTRDSARGEPVEVDENVLGFFEGSADATFSSSPYPKRIVLMQRHIERYARSRADLVDQVTDTVLHEVAHYFGLDHADISETRLRH